ncbi:LAQU0S01e02146g1_1 [Lachancea quebecensis]|uniref:LAQU0S01e02146g1_1 n=1 Tax=Lachancea quebecensis TaxID=1654605 RepID=A0A0P1KLQ2_9SACH|nr:LAQU0S01e02146g1_1 [Lachancea quebecensis]
MATMTDLNEAYRQTQSQIYSLQQTILNSSRTREQDPTPSREHGAFHGRKNGCESSSSTQAVRVNSKPILELVASHYTANRRHLGTLRYNAWSGAEARESVAQMEPDFEYMRLIMPRPFLPELQASDINCLMSIEVSYEDIAAAAQLHSPNLHVTNNEMWGSDIYTDDSDILLVLRHCGVIPSSSPQSHARTPANLADPDHVVGTIPPAPTAYDLKVDILLLPPLQAYSSSLRNGLKSRPWHTCHDGLSYGIYSIEVKPRDTSTQNIPLQDRIKTAEW